MPENSNSLLPGAALLRTKVIGIGSAGGNIVAALLLPQPGLSVLAVNTDARALSSLSIQEKIVLGEQRTRGWGSGGDPEVGKAAAEADRRKISSFGEEADLVFLIAGLGGGTGTGATPVFIDEVRESGAMVLSVTTTPFEFEGSKRSEQAQEGLMEIGSRGDGVICLSNESLLAHGPEGESLQETLQRINQYIAKAVLSLHRLFTRPGLVHLDFADVAAAARGGGGESALFVATAEGSNRADELGKKIRSFCESMGSQELSMIKTVLVGVAAGSDLGMNEVRQVVEHITSQFPEAQLLLGAALDETMGNQMEVLFLGTIGEKHSNEPPGSETKTAGTFQRHSPAISTDSPGIWTEAKASRPRSRFVAPPPQLSPEEKEKLFSQQKRSGKTRKKSDNRMRQGTLGLEIISKGRFEKSEPTIHHGEDLDVPTYIRRGIPLN